MKLKKLYPSFADPETWRTNIKGNIGKEEWKKIEIEDFKEG